MTPEQKARKVAEELTTAWFNLTDPDQMDDWLEDHITAAILQFAQEQESEAVRELVAGLKPFAFSPMGLFDETTCSNLIDEAGQERRIRASEFREAATLIAKHSKKGPNP